MALVGAISQQIWDMKYRLRAPGSGDVAGEPLDKTIEDTWRRVATALATPEREPEKWAERFYQAMEDFKFLPAGPRGGRRRHRPRRSPCSTVL